nr:MAG TPA: hypothetical protein [Caudoviricetes sp.]
MDFKGKTAGQVFGAIAGQVTLWFISAAFIW